MAKSKKSKNSKVTKSELRGGQLQLEQQLLDLRDELVQLDGKRRRLRSRLRTLEHTVDQLATTVGGRTAEPDAADVEAAAVITASEEPVISAGTPPGRDASDRDPRGVPDETWTVIQLRGLAKEKSIPGSSRLSKAQLLDAVR